MRRLSGSGFNSLEFQSKKSIRTYLNSVQKKYVHPDEIKKDTVIFTPFYGAWLEALALVTANSPEEVSQFITHFINNKTLSEQIIFKDGLSNKY